jgi:hypothetical protein
VARRVVGEEERGREGRVEGQVERRAQLPRRRTQLDALPLRARSGQHHLLLVC